ncbi:DUF4097 family beta strand repeat-containing protein [Actomonas aquatica]|uniref:DUF4097 family beta strand repeat-containing protein n=1 Tax=Actomonas aquatica TaxID=2866162 RepID=A0ABZ1CAU0_9BACT|nr:DUF4097 family beta strand repeat-containing protein [Opitutus sp. WL0086]WRQ88656.1 DUF4097 family beta strand repeat-containing protein [Opitutus sp. WL0086]
MLRKLLLPALLLLTPAFTFAKINREVERSFTVRPGSEIKVDISGGSIKAEIVRGDTASLTLHQTFHTNDERDIAEILERYKITFEQQGDDVVLDIESAKSGGWFSGWSKKNRASFKVTLTCPDYVDLNLDTSGGSISVDGEVTGDLIADTSGGSINVTGGTGYLNLDTSGGSISVKRALGRVRADTSGGSIRINYVGPDVEDVNADTSGGSIKIGLDPDGSYDLYADTSGGRVTIDELAITPHKITRTHAEGEINGGGARVRADTSGGSITIYAADQ